MKKKGLNSIFIISINYIVNPIKASAVVYECGRYLCACECLCVGWRETNENQVYSNGNGVGARGVYTIQYAVLSVATFGSTNYKTNSVVVVATKRLDAIIESIQFSRSTYEKHVTHPWHINMHTWWSDTYFSDFHEVRNWSTHSPIVGLLGLKFQAQFESNGGVQRRAWKAPIGQSVSSNFTCAGFEFSSLKRSHSNGGWYRTKYILYLCVVHAEISAAKHTEIHEIIYISMYLAMVDVYMHVCTYNRKSKKKFNSSSDLIETDLNSISMHMSLKLKL